MNLSSREESNLSGNSSEEQTVPFLELLNIQPGEVGEGTARFEVVVEEWHLRTLGIIHGGAIATLLDTAMGVAAKSLAPADHFVVTMQLNINFTRPAWKGERISAKGEVQHSGKQTAVARGEVCNAEGALVGTGTATFMYLKKPADEEHLPQNPPQSSS